MNEYAATLNLVLEPDPRVANLVVAAHTAAIGVAVGLCPTAPITGLALLVTVLASLRWVYREHVSREGAGAIRTLSVSATGEWTLTRNGRSAREKASLRYARVYDDWVVLRFGFCGARSRSLILTSAVTGSDRLRQLRARARLSAWSDVS